MSSPVKSPRLRLASFDSSPATPRARPTSVDSPVITPPSTPRIRSASLEAPSDTPLSQASYAPSMTRNELKRLTPELERLTQALKDEYVCTMA
jgi:hypothetical protein